VPNQLSHRDGVLRKGSEVLGRKNWWPHKQLWPQDTILKKNLFSYAKPLHLWNVTWQLKNGRMTDEWWSTKYLVGRTGDHINNYDHKIQLLRPCTVLISLRHTTSFTKCHVTTEQYTFVRTCSIFRRVFAIDLLRHCLQAIYRNQPARTTQAKTGRWPRPGFKQGETRAPKGEKDAWLPPPLNRDERRRESNKNLRHQPVSLFNLKFNGTDVLLTVFTRTEVAATSATAHGERSKVSLYSKSTSVHCYRVTMPVLTGNRKQSVCYVADAILNELLH
jgi:hypothetical protein